MNSCGEIRLTSSFSFSFSFSFSTALPSPFLLLLFFTSWPSSASFLSPLSFSHPFFVQVPFLLETTLRKSGAVLDVRSIPFLPNVIQYKELISAQGPTSSSQFGSTFKDALIRFNNSHLSGTVSASSATPTIASPPPASANAYASPSDFAKKRSTEEIPSYQNVGSMATEVVTPNSR
jgi:hypothetical protein